MCLDHLVVSARAYYNGGYKRCSVLVASLLSLYHVDLWLRRLGLDVSFFYLL